MCKKDLCEEIYKFINIYKEKGVSFEPIFIEMTKKFPNISMKTVDDAITDLICADEQKLFLGFKDYNETPRLVYYSNNYANRNKKLY